MAKILVVDDAVFMRAKASRLLTQEGFQVIEASDGAQAVEAYSSQKPDVVLMDITMPVLDGISALRAIRAIDATAKVIMVTALGQRSMVLESIRAGARDFVIKPFQAEKLVEAVRKQCQP